MMIYRQRIWDCLVWNIFIRAFHGYSFSVKIAPVSWKLKRPWHVKLFTEFGCWRHFVAWFGCRSQSVQHSASRAFRLSLIFVHRFGSEKTSSEDRHLSVLFSLQNHFSRHWSCEVHSQSHWELDPASRRACHRSWTWCSGETQLYRVKWPRVRGWQSDDCCEKKKTHFSSRWPQVELGEVCLTMAHIQGQMRDEGDGAAHCYHYFNMFALANVLQYFLYWHYYGS